MTLTNENWDQFRTIVHSDWSVHGKKRWSAIAQRTKNGWRIEAIELFAEISDLLSVPLDQSILAGFDFPIGMPGFWYEAVGIPDFVSFIDKVRSGEFPQFFMVSDAASEISFSRPFYPNSAGKKNEKKKQHLLSQLNLSISGQLLRQCEKAHGNRKDASPLFWTIGAKQVGKAALSGWKEVIFPLYEKGAILWPFETLQLTNKSKNLVLVETYPAHYYDFFEPGLMKGRSKRRQNDRKIAGSKILAWLVTRNVRVLPSLETKIKDGFGLSEDGEDPFDALVGLCGMLDVVLGNRSSTPQLSPLHLDKEGWIFGQVECSIERHVSCRSPLETKNSMQRTGKMTFDEALIFASEGSLAKAVKFFGSDENPSAKLVLKHEEQVEFHTSEGMPTTSLRREFVLTCDGVTLTSWWEDYEGYYGSGFTGWWIEEIDADGPPKGLEALLAEVGLAIPDVEVPRPPIPEEDEE